MDLTVINYLLAAGVVLECLAIAVVIKYKKKR